MYCQLHRIRERRTLQIRKQAHEQYFAVRRQELQLQSSPSSQVNKHNKPPSDNKFKAAILNQDIPQIFQTLKDPACDTLFLIQQHCTDLFTLTMSRIQQHGSKVKFAQVYIMSLILSYCYNDVGVECDRVKLIELLYSSIFENLELQKEPMGKKQYGNLQKLNYLYLACLKSISFEREDLLFTKNYLYRYIQPFFRHFSKNASYLIFLSFISESANIFVSHSQVDLKAIDCIMEQSVPSEMCVEMYENGSANAHCPKSIVIASTIILLNFLQSPQTPILYLQHNATKLTLKIQQIYSNRIKIFSPSLSRKALQCLTLLTTRLTQNASPVSMFAVMKQCSMLSLLLLLLRIEAAQTKYVCLGILCALVDNSRMLVTEGKEGKGEEGKHYEELRGYFSDQLLYAVADGLDYERVEIVEMCLQAVMAIVEFDTNKVFVEKLLEYGVVASLESLQYHTNQVISAYAVQLTTLFTNCPTD